MRLGILTALWRRPALTEAVLDYYRTLDVPGVDLVRVAVKSPDDPEPVPHVVNCQWDGAWHYVNAPNSPLSDKFNAGMAEMRKNDVDAVMVVGSDDLVTTAYIARAAEEVKRGAGLVIFDTLHCLDVETGETFRCQPKRLGGGRTLAARALDAVGWQPWPPGRDRKLDGGMDLRFRALQRRPQNVLLRAQQVPGAVILALKSEHADGTSANLWPFAQIRDGLRGERRDGALLMEMHFPSVNLPVNLSGVDGA